MTDSNACIVEYLRTSGTALYTLVGTRIYMAGELPNGFANTQAAIVFSARGGDEGRYVEHHAPSFEVRCFGGSMNYGDAWAVYGALYDLFHAKHMLSTTAGTILRAESEQFPQEMSDPDEGWPCVLGFWKVETRPN